MGARPYELDVAALYLDRHQNPEWLHWACHGIEFLDRHGFDSDGRMFFLLDRRGKALRKRRYAFSESFAAIAYALHAKATQNAASADPQHGVVEAFHALASGSHQRL